MIPPMPIARRLRDLRTRNGQSQTELASSAGCCAMTVSKIERGIVLPRADTLLALARALNTTTDYLLGKAPD